jgi:hypothetical protein
MRRILTLPILCVALVVTALSSTLGTPIGDGTGDPLGTDSTSLTTGLDTIIEAMVSEGMVMESCVGYTCIEPEQWQWYLQFRAAATDAELIRFVEHVNPVVCCYAFRALVDRNHPDVFDILIGRLTDTTTVRVFSGCNIIDMAVADDMITAVQRKRVGASQSVLSTAQRTTVDSLLLYTPNLKFGNRRRLLEGLKPREEDHPRLRQLVVEEGENDALVALARHRRPEDCPLVLAALRSEDRNILYKGLGAVHAFPDESFYGELVGVFRRLLAAHYTYPFFPLEQVCITLALYPRASTVALFRDALRETLAWDREDIIDLVSAAVTTHRHPIFVDLLPLLEMDQDAVAAYRRSLELNVPE